MKKKKGHIYICGRCGYRSQSKLICHTCHIHLEKQCKRCLNAKGNCICKIYNHSRLNKKIKISKIKKRR